MNRAMALQELVRSIQKENALGNKAPRATVSQHISRRSRAALARFSGLCSGQSNDMFNTVLLEICIAA
jgi:hypothetical protein